MLGASEINQGTWDELEAILIQADLGLPVVQSILTTVSEISREKGITRSVELYDLLRKDLQSRLQIAASIEINPRPFVILLVGVNGSGKTTTAAKLGYRYMKAGYKVLLTAADTFRAAGIDQLQIWSDRLGLPVVAGQMGADPGAVTFDAIQSAISKKMDIVLIDTAGRLHTRYNLMEELKKVARVAGKALPGAPHAVWLVLDSTTGQNALQQARSFKEAVGVTGVILAKLDSSAKGGMAFAIRHELGLPILFAGLGERADDLQLFDPDAFVAGLLG